MQVQRQTVEQLADGAPRLPMLHVPVPQMLDQPVAVLARFDLPIPEQVIEVPKISCPSRFSRAALRSPRMEEQLVEVPVPSVLRSRSWHRSWTLPAARGIGSQHWMGGTRGVWRVHSTPRGPARRGSPPAQGGI